MNGVLFQNDPLISIVKTVNNGAAFGILSDNPYILGTLGIIVLLVIAIYIFKNTEFKDKNKILLCSVFAGGILGNTTERFYYGYVQDFIKIKLFDFPIFNLYDVLISASVFLYILYSVKKEIKKRLKNCK